MSGVQHHAGDLAGVAAGLVALGDDDVDAVAHVRQRVLGGAGERGDLDAVLVAFSITSTGGEPSALAISTGRCFSATSRCERATECSQPRTPSRPSPSGQRRDAELEQRLVDELPVLLGDHRARGRPRCPRSGSSSASRCRRRTACRRCCRRARSASRSSSSASLNRTQPSTPRPPARETAAATCSDGVNAKIGYSIPNSSQRAVRMLLSRSDGGSRWRPSASRSAISLAAGYCALPVALRGISVDEGERARQLVAGQVRAQVGAQLLELERSRPPAARRPRRPPGRTSRRGRRPRGRRTRRGGP